MVLDTIPWAIKHDVIHLTSKGYTEEEAAGILGISVSTIQRAKHKLRYHGDIEGGKKKKGTKGKLDHADIEVCTPRDGSPNSAASSLFGLFSSISN